MFSRFFQAILRWWRNYQEENQFIYNTLSDLHRKLQVFDIQENFWTTRRRRDVTICKGKKFPMYLYGKTDYLCTIFLEKIGGVWSFVLVDCSSSSLIPMESTYTLTQLDVLVGVLKVKYGI
jgi:hypothetical protein